jgi:hypothetical protein
MVGFLAVTLFVGSFAFAAYVIAASIGPNAGRIVDTLFGRQVTAAPLATLVRAERRIAVRRWAAASAPTPAARQLRAAA